MGRVDHLVNLVTATGAIHRNGRFFINPFGLSRSGLTPRPEQANHNRMQQAIATIALVVADYDEAIAFYRDAVGFSLVEDKLMGGEKRWVVMAPKGQGGARLLLAKADGPEQQAVVGRQAVGRVMLFLETDDFARDYKRMVANGVSFIEEPRHEPYGSVAVFVDLYGNKWDLIEPRR